MSNVMRWTEEQLEAHQAKRAREYAKKDFVDVGIGTMRAEVVDTESHGAGDCATPQNLAHKEPRIGFFPDESPDAVAPQRTLLSLRRMTFELPLPPSVNALYGTAKNGRKFLHDEQREFRSQVIALVRARTRQPEGRVPPLEGRLCLRAAFYQANNIRQDISNRIKALEDALMYAGAYHDDSQIDKLIIERRFSKRATCVVELEEIA